MKWAFCTAGVGAAALHSHAAVHNNTLDQGLNDMNYLLVGVGGMLGSVTRYAASTWSLQLFPNVKFPAGTFLVNLIGCLLIGIMAGLIERASFLNAEIRLFCITGFLGGFTTFSAFGVETFYLLRSGELLLASMYAVASVVLGIALVFIGLRVVS